jgi:hypothetical protein
MSSQLKKIQKKKTTVNTIRIFHEINNMYGAY